MEQSNIHALLEPEKAKPLLWSMFFKELVCCHELNNAKIEAYNTLNSVLYKRRMLQKVERSLDD